MPVKESLLVNNAPIALTLSGRIAQRIRQHHAESQIGTAFGGKTHVEKFVIEIIEAFLSERRSNRMPPMPDYWERNGSDEDHARV